MLSHEIGNSNKIEKFLADSIQLAEFDLAEFLNLFTINTELVTGICIILVLVSSASYWAPFESDCDW